MKQNLIAYLLQQIVRTKDTFLYFTVSYITETNDSTNEKEKKKKEKK